MFTFVGVSFNFPLEIAFLFLEFKSIGVFSPFGNCSETEESSLELAAEADNLLNFLSGLNSIWV